MFKHIMSIKIKPDWGSNLTDVLTDCVELAKLCNCAVMLKFNGVKLAVYPASGIGELARIYHYLLRMGEL